MSVIRNTTRLISGSARFFVTGVFPSFPARNVCRSGARAISSYPPRCAAASGASLLEKKLPPRRLGKVYKFLLQDDGGSFSNKEDIPKIALKHVSVSFTGQGESTSKVQATTEAKTKPHKKGGSLPSNKKKGSSQKQNANAATKPRIRNINTAGTRVILRLDIQNASWLSERVRERIVLMEKDRIRDGKLELTSSKTRKQENNYDEAVTKMNKLLQKFQAIINAASYTPLPTPKKVLDKIVNFRAGRAEAASEVSAI